MGAIRSSLKRKHRGLYQQIQALLRRRKNRECAFNVIIVRHRNISFVQYSCDEGLVTALCPLSMITDQSTVVSCQIRAALPG